MLRRAARESGLRGRPFPRDHSPISVGTAKLVTNSATGLAPAQALPLARRRPRRPSPCPRCPALVYSDRLESNSLDSDLQSHPVPHCSAPTRPASQHASRLQSQAPQPLARPPCRPTPPRTCPAQPAPRPRPPQPTRPSPTTRCRSTSGPPQPAQPIASRAAARGTRSRSSSVTFRWSRRASSSLRRSVCPSGCRPRLG